MKKKSTGIFLIECNPHKSAGHSNRIFYDAEGNPQLHRPHARTNLTKGRGGKKKRCSETAFGAAY